MMKTVTNLLPSNNLIGPIEWADWYDMRQLHLYIKRMETSRSHIYDISLERNKEIYKTYMSKYI